ncbi:polyphosphate kinase 1 [Halosquirtibacter laminarini]|uniref:Polyphosphate kinase 1 n=1 Tax=Halosquirtibacter laminarini TaxID=3374600 RepID=A0AC61NPE7_9BACT|nr:polyphosphate kinase 1 [Prolixibacteraceae bacterium]
MSLLRRYNNRELSWLSFNERVLQEADDPSVPLLERLRFLGIFSKNLDEFFRVRVASVKRMVKHGIEMPDQIGTYSPDELLEQIMDTVNEQQLYFKEIYEKVKKDMSLSGISIVDEKELTDIQGKYVKRFFYDTVLPYLVPIMLNDLSNFPDLSDGAIYLTVVLSRESKKKNDHYFAILRIPSNSLSRYVELPNGSNQKSIIMLDDVIRYCLDDLFHIFNYDKAQAYSLKVTRDAEIDLDDDISTTLIQKMEDSLKRRKKGNPVRIIYDREMPKELFRFITRKMNINIENIVPGGRYHNRGDFMSFPRVGSDTDYYQSIVPLEHPLLKRKRSVIRAIKKQDIMLHYPYQSFNHFIDFLREVAIDPKVVEIGVTIYRVASDSKVINALINAARNGKKVTVLIELQARFDEKANIYWSNTLQEAGVQVISGIPGLKVHSKLVWVQRIENDIPVNYGYIGTGNHNESTAKIYSDIGLFTSDTMITQDLENLFRFFRHNYMHFDYNRLIVSPFYLRNFLVDCIEQEISNAKNGIPAFMILKMNSLVDKEMADKLYEASSAGVKIDIIVRGISVVVPGVPGLSENIRTVSIVDKFLEHSRIWLFHNNGENSTYISSADWMPRNLNRRIEIACPVKDEVLKNELIDYLQIQLSDNVKARENGRGYRNIYINKNESGMRCQDAFYDYLKEKQYD